MNYSEVPAGSKGWLEPRLAHFYAPLVPSSNLEFTVVEERLAVQLRRAPG